jgi:soluble lytic murein transglycosylase-like protein
VAEALAQAEHWQLPPDLVTAIAWQESRFNPHIDNIGRRVAEGREIGPMQVRPIAFRDVGMDPLLAIGLPLPQRVAYVVAAGLAYLRLLQTRHLSGASWCSILHAYNVGPTAYLAGRRNHVYVNSVIRQALQYSELRA